LRHGVRIRLAISRLSTKNLLIVSKWRQARITRKRDNAMVSSLAVGRAEGRRGGTSRHRFRPELGTFRECPLGFESGLVFTRADRGPTTTLHEGGRYRMGMPAHGRPKEEAERLCLAPSSGDDRTADPRGARGPKGVGKEGRVKLDWADEDSEGRLFCLSSQRL
jgi:hypothetical protein